MAYPHTERGARSMLQRETAAHAARFSRVMPLALRRAPLLFAAAMFASGVAFSVGWRPAATLVFATSLCIAVAALSLRWAPRLATVATLLVWLLLGWTLGTLHPRPGPDRALLPFMDGLRRDVDATVMAVQPLARRVEAQGLDDPPRYAEQAADQDPAQTGETMAAVTLKFRNIEQVDADAASMLPATGTARIVLDAADAGQMNCGEDVRLTVRLYHPREFRDPGVWSYANWLLDQDVTATGTGIPGTLHRTGPQSRAWHCRVQRLQGFASGRLRRFGAWQAALPRLPHAVRWTERDVAAWQAMLFGDRTALTHPLRADFERTGTFHLFVVSGLHIGLVAAAVFWVLDRMRWGRVPTAVTTALLTTAYALLTGFGEPAQRALFMTVAYLLAEAIGRERNPLNAVGAAVLAMLLLRPQALFDSGLQMTVLIALTIAGIAVPLLERTVAPYARACRRLPLIRLDRRMPPRVAQFRVRLRWLVNELSETYGRWFATLVVATVRVGFAVLTASVLALVTELTMALPMAVYFHRFTAFALPANLLVIPLLVPLMVCGIVTFLLSLVSFHAALLAAVPAALLLHAASGVVHALASLHGAELRTPGPPVPAALLLLSCVAVCIVLLHRTRRRPAWAGVAVACAISIGTVALARRMAAPCALQVTAIDVGQGDSILVTAPNGTSMLIDAGGIVASVPRAASPGATQPAANAAFDTGEEVVSPFLWRLGIRRLDVLALSHAHMDHLGGMSAVLRNFRPRELWLSVDSSADDALIAEARTQGAEVRFLRAPQQVNWQGVRLDVLSPQPGYVPASMPTNDDSLVLRAMYGRSSALLEGDAEQLSEAAMLAAGRLAPVTLLKVGHHGSLTSSTEPFLDAVEPRVAVISCGRGNHFGHPRMPVLERLAELHTMTARTDTMGALRYTLTADGAVTTEVLHAGEE